MVLYPDIFSFQILQTVQKVSKIKLLSYAHMHAHTHTDAHAHTYTHTHTHTHAYTQQLSVQGGEAANGG